VLYAWVVAVTRPALIERVVIGGTLMTGLALVLVLVALHLLRKAGTARAPLPPHLASRLPGLAPRADRIAGFGAWILAGLLVAAAAVLVAAGWDWVDVGALWARSAVQGALWRLLTALLVVFGAAALWAGVASWIDARLGEGPDARKGRSRTLLALFRNAFTVAVAVLAGMVALSQLGLDIAPLLAGAGVVGLAVGFGAQKLVQDIITGIFIQLENAMDVGDVVGVAGIQGGVEHVSIRSVRLRTMDGATHIIPFSSVTTVANLTRDFAFHVAELQVGYGQDVEGVKASLREAFDRLVADTAMAADVLEPLEPPVVAGLRETAMLLRTRIKTRAGRQWDVGNRYSEILKQVLDEHGVEIPVAQRTILLPAGGSA
jgi:small-conductance mechanosensitive channel